MRCLWDTDIMSEFLKGKHPHVARRAAAYLNQYRQASISLITRYEILRGLKATSATTLLARFESICQKHKVLAVSNNVVVLAADLWASLKRAGQLIGDNDLIIAATALRHRLALATGNTAHFSRIPGLTLDDWTKP